MSKLGLNILYLGCPGFPYGLAEVQRVLLISKALVNERAKVTVICSKSIHSKNTYPELKKAGHYQGIPYIYSSGIPYRYKNFIMRNSIKLFEKILEFILIYKLNKKEKIDAAIVSSMNIKHVLLYKVLSKLLNFKVVLNLVEINSAMSTRKSVYLKINDYLFDRYAVSLSDGILPISEHLISFIKEIDFKKPYLKVPVIVDIDRFSGIEKESSEEYFLYCGAALYYELIFFIIESFELIKGERSYLYLVINGSDSYLSAINSRVNDSVKSDSIKVFSRISEKQLSLLYKNALSLLIPLRPTIQDKARFPHKTGEYLASGNPVITTNFGEMSYYLKDMDNALVASRFDVKEFSDKMNQVLIYPNECLIIGAQGKLTAEKYFDYKIYGAKIIDFITELSK